MPEDIASIPTEGKGSQTPSQVPSLHTPEGQGAGATGVNNVDKTPGQPGAPTKPPIGGGGGGGIGGAPGALPGGAGAKPPVMPQKTPEQLLNDRSEKRLKEDIEDILITHESQQNRIIKLGRISFDEIDLETLIKELVDQKGWRVDRLKELLPSRDEKEIMNYFNDLLQDSTKSEETVSDVNQQPVTPPIPLPEAPGMGKKSNSSVRRNNIMAKEEILVNNGKLESVTNITESLNRLSYAIDSAAQARKALKEARIRKAGLESLGKGLGLGKEMGEGSMGGPEKSPMGGLGGPEKSPMGGGMGGGIDMEDDLDSIGMSGGGSPEEKLVEALKSLTDVLKDFLAERSEGKIGADDAIKSDTMIGKAKDELGKGKEMIAGPKKPFGGEEKKPPFGGGEKKPEAGEEVEKKKEEKEEVAASDDTTVKTAMDPAAGGKKVNISSAQAGKPESGPLGGKGGEGGNPMNATMEAKAQVLEKIKQRMAKLAEARKANLYPFKQPKEYDFADINAQKAGEQASEINSDISSGEMVKDKTDKFLGQSREKGSVNLPSDPGMDISKPANKAAEDSLITIKQANAKTAYEIDQTVAKIKLAMEVASVQQLKGLISNPLKEAMIKNMVAEGIVKEAAEAIVHNAYLDGFQQAQEEVIAEAFGTLAKQDMDEFIKVANFTKKYSGEFNTSVQEVEKTEPQVRTASEKSSIALRGSQVTKESDDRYSKFWKQVNAERISGR